MLLQELRDDAREWVSTELSAAQYPDAVLDVSLNQWYRKTLGWILPDQGEWEINGDIITIDTETGVTDYEIPVGLLRFYKAEIMYRTGGQYVPLTALSIQRNQDEAEGNTTRPIDSELSPTIEVFGDFFQVRPAPTEDVVNGFKVWAQLDFEDMTDTMNLPNILAPVQRVIAIGAALDYCIKEGMTAKTLELKRLIYGDARVPDDTGYKGELVALYSNRTGNRRDRVVARRTSFR